MQFIKNTSKGSLEYLRKFLIRVVLIVFVIFLAVILVGKIDFPAPNKRIEKPISNENFKTIK